ncbi:class I SAM-dependent methyltransferase [Idiomarina abyssalis]|uniref:class I SAM-dependent methyltransferase n=1 Tax=Idiomarina abyssalis TaxID=86102 RepID=UPI003A94D55B
MNKSIFKFLSDLGLTSEKTRELFNERTRDIDDLKVWRDKVSGVIYIDEFYTGNNTYLDGSYREQQEATLQTGKLDYECAMDADRRLKSCLKFVAGKKIADFGCGRGDFLKVVSPYCSEVKGIELQQDYVDHLNSVGVSCVDDLAKIKDKSLDVIVSFHVIEHLPKPLEILTELKNKVVSGGTVIIEVPHANDFLLSVVHSESFKQFTLWSQHLVLHTRESLRKVLESVGFEDVQIKGVQRYPLSNHLNWLNAGKPGGHKSPLSLIDSPELDSAYESSLASINATDTLVAIAKVS